MEIKRAGSQASTVGPPEYFTGTVRIDPLNTVDDPGRHACATVTFEPGARTAWHTHPYGQTLVVVAGCGWTQSDGGPRQTIRPGDIVSIAANERHWHGATAKTAMAHIAIHEREGDSAVYWLEHVTDEQYQTGGTE